MTLIATDSSSIWVDLLVYVTVTATVFSGLDYLFRFKALLEKEKTISN